MFFSAIADRFSKFFHQVIQTKILCNITEISTSPAICLLHYHVKIENPKMLPNFHVERALLICLTKI